MLRKRHNYRRLSCELLENRDLLAVRFAVIGDYGALGANADRVAALIHHASWDVDFVVTVGDNNYGQIDVGHADWENHVGARYGDFIQARADNKYPRQTSSTQRFFPAVGNHDGTATGSGQTGQGGLIPGYIDYFVTNPGHPARLGSNVAEHTAQLSYYDVRWDHVHLFVVDSDHARSSTSARIAQQQWLSTAMAASDATWKFVVMHHPPYSSSLVHGSDTAMQWDFADWEADAVFSGHDHTYERIVGPDDHLLYFVSGLGGRSIYGLGDAITGSQFRYNDSYGAMRVTLDGAVATYEFLTINDGANGANGGQVIDTIMVNKQVAVDTPRVLNVVRNDGRNRPDTLDSLQFSFSQVVSASLDLGDLRVRDMRSTAPRSLSRTDFSAALGRWDFSRENLGVGFYEITLLGTRVESPSGTLLDGNGDGQPGDSWVGIFLVAARGDANLDGSVDATDWTIWNANRGQAGSWQQADFNHDGLVDSSDFAFWNVSRFTDLRPKISLQRNPRAAASESEAVPIAVAKSSPNPTTLVDLVHRTADDRSSTLTDERYSTTSSFVFSSNRHNLRRRSIVPVFYAVSPDHATPLILPYYSCDFHRNSPSKRLRNSVADGCMSW